MGIFNKLIFAGAGVFAAGQLLKPRSDKFGKVRRIMQSDFAYKGVFNNVDVPENSMLAYEMAIDSEVGIFANMMLTADNVPVLIQRDSVVNMLGVRVDIESLTINELRTYTLLDTTLTVPTLEALLNFVNGRVPVYIRVENYKKHSASTVIGAIGSLVDNYEGEILFDTQDEGLLRIRMLHRPDLIFGKMLESRLRSNGREVIRNFMKHNLLTNAMTSPDFISCRYSDRQSIGLNACRSIYGIPVFYWPVRSAEQYDTAMDEGAGVIVYNN